MNVLKTHTLNRVRQQMNQIVKTAVQYVHHLLESVTPPINRFVDNLFTKILPEGARSVLEIVQVGNRNAIHDLLLKPHTA